MPKHMPQGSMCVGIPAFTCTSPKGGHPTAWWDVEGTRATRGKKRKKKPSSTRGAADLVAQPTQKEEKTEKKTSIYPQPPSKAEGKKEPARTPKNLCHLPPPGFAVVSSTPRGPHKTARSGGVARNIQRRQSNHTRPRAGCVALGAGEEGQRERQRREVRATPSHGGTWKEHETRQQATHAHNSRQARKGGTRLDAWKPWMEWARELRKWGGEVKAMWLQE
mmetsp:Transcript_31769/g.80827  ORF Transcript_31769/g.80827 Transcript_31769/m.80827 type:complete len:221 (-) Transcript_31769:42-704(-)